jgi:uncharacterized protein
LPPQSAIIIMAKQPRPGKTKTRLCPPFTPDSAAALFEALLKDTIHLVNGQPGVQLAVAISPPEAMGYFQSITPPGALLLPVEGANIGECLEKALAELLGMGFPKAIALNADGPSLPPAYLAQAVQALDEHEVVLGPDEDGGYYLIGFRGECAPVFHDVLWSTDQVLQKTLAHTARLGVKTALLPEWYDVDTPADARRLHAELTRLPDARLPHTRLFFARHTPPQAQA